MYASSQCTRHHFLLQYHLHSESTFRIHSHLPFSILHMRHSQSFVIMHHPLFIGHAIAADPLSSERVGIVPKAFWGRPRDIPGTSWGCPADVQHLPIVFRSHLFLIIVRRSSCVMCHPSSSVIVSFHSSSLSFFEQSSSSPRPQSSFMSES